MSGDVTFDPIALDDLLDLGDLEDYEDLTGTRWSRLQDGQDIGFKQIRALMYLVRRKTEPGLTFDDCRDMKVNEVQAVFDRLAKPLGKLRAVESAAN